MGEGWDIKAAKASDIQEGIAKGCLVSSCLVQSTMPLFRGRDALLPVSPIRLLNGQLCIAFRGSR